MKNGKMFEYFSRDKGIALIEGRRRCAGRVLLEIPVMGGSAASCRRKKTAHARLGVWR